MKQVLAAIVCILTTIPAALPETQEAVQLKIFGRVGVGVRRTCTMGASAETMKKLRALEERENSLDHWLSQNFPINPKYQRLFKNEPVSYKVTFAGKRDIGNLLLTRHVSEEAQEAALLSLKRTLPLTDPPNDLPYRRGLLIRFDSKGVTVHLASPPLI